MVIIDSMNGYSKAMQSGTILGLQLHEMLSYLGQLGLSPLWSWLRLAS
jgi:hypothetical protein